MSPKRYIGRILALIQKFFNNYYQIKTREIFESHNISWLPSVIYFVLMCISRTEPVNEISNLHSVQCKSHVCELKTCSFN